MAINTLSFMQNMPDPGQAFAQAFQQAQQQRALQQQQQAQMDQQQRFAQWQERLRTDYSPETLAQFGLEFPQQAKAVQEAFAPLQKAERENRFKFNSQVFDALSKKDVDRAKEILTQRIAAAKNTMGRDQEVAELEYWLPELDRDPDAALSALAKVMYFDDGDAYKTLYDKKEKPYVVVPGVGLFLQRDIDAAIAAGDRGGVSEPNVRPKVPQAAIDDLRKNPGTATQFDEVFGPGAAAAALGMSGTPAPADGATSLTPAQYQATVQALGKVKTDDWMRRNNMTVSGR